MAEPAPAVSHPHIILYSKPGCHLCDEARAILDDIAAQPMGITAFTLDEIDIRRDEALFTRYRYRIPVITLNGAVIAEGRIEENETWALRQALAAPTRG